MRKNGFTLIELLVVIAIIGVLAVGAVSVFNEIQKKSRDTHRLADMQHIRKALQLFFTENEHYPGPTGESVSTSAEELGDDMGNIETVLAPYFQRIPKDPIDDADHYYSYDPQHNTDDPQGSCNAAGVQAVVFGFNRAEASSTTLIKDTCSGSDQNLDDADYNIALRSIGP